MATSHRKLRESKSPEFREHVIKLVQQMNDDIANTDPLKRFPRGFLYTMHRDEKKGDYVLQSQDDPELVVRGDTPDEAVVAMEKVYADINLSNAD